MKTIVFHSNQISITGTEIALFDYAKFNETILGNKSIILYNKYNKNNNPEAIEKFNREFNVIGYESAQQIDSILFNLGADILYAIKAGRRDDIISRRIPTMVHAVFPTSPLQIHGNSYAFISEWLSNRCSNNLIPSVPHIINMPNISDDLRQELEIPETAFVLGCYGGSRSYDVKCAISGMLELVKKRRDIYFIFMNLIPFSDHPRIIFLPGTSDVKRKTKFINSCNSMVHARAQGETFGLACGEFSARNKPIITYQYCKHTHHHDVLGKSGFYYRNHNEFVKIINEMDPESLRNKKWDCYSTRYSPEIVMKKFTQNLIIPALENQSVPPLPISSYISFLKNKAMRRI